MRILWIISAIASILTVASSVDPPPKVMQITGKQYFPKKCTQLHFLPMPKSIHCDLTNTEPYYIQNPCNIKYILKINRTTQQQQTHDKQHTQTQRQSQKHGDSIEHFVQLIDDQQYKTFRCRASKVYKNKNPIEESADYIVEVNVNDGRLRSAFTKEDQAYRLHIGQNRASISAEHYVGFVRGLETFLQALNCSRKYDQCHFTALPISIQDSPLFQFRGLLVDTSRHFVPMHMMKETIDAMMYNKMNVFHWHIVDDDSFPLELKSHPEMAQYGAFSEFERYTLEQVKDFIHYAMIRGVRIIPEIDTPGHAASWAHAPQNSDIACIQMSSKYKGPLDVTLQKTYQIMKQIFTEIFELFPDPYVHLGGDEVELNCLANKTDFMNLEGVELESKIQLQYRKKQRQILKSVNASKKFLYWIPDQLSQIEPDDVVHWWGKKHLVPEISYRKIIISQYVGQFYIDMGVGNILGTSYYDYSTWLDIYKLNIGKQISNLPNKANVIGCMVTLWTEMSNLYTHHSRIWIRCSSLAERMWTEEDHDPKPDFLRRITAHERLMNRRGIPTAPATCQQCETYPQFC